MVRLGFVIFFTLLALNARAVTPDKPLYAEVFLKTGNEKVAGNVSAWDSAGAVLRVGKEDRNLKWADLTPTSAFVLRSRLIDKNGASDWLALGTMAWQTGLTTQGKSALTMAAKLEPALKPRVDELLAKPATRPVIAHARAAPATAPVKYLKSTPDQDGAAIAEAQRVSGAVSAAMKIKFTEIQTAHFILFTDWDPREFGFLKTNIEGAYTAVSRQFDIPAKENVFVGKLPVFMFSGQMNFIRYAQMFDDLPPNVGLLGYYAGHGNGTGHMAMWKPRQQVNGVQGQSPEEQWAYTLTHEFTHAFVDRYKSNRRIPRWLNEGLAEVIAQTQFPQKNRKMRAREMYEAEAPLDQLFDDEQMPGGEYYPVMQTMVEMLIQKNRATFLKYFDAIKDGEKPEAALMKYFGVDYPALAKAWRKYISH